MSQHTMEDLSNIEVEHLLSASTHEGQVKLRAVGRNTVMLGQVDPAVARKLAHDLMSAAARAEYEQDFISELKREGFDDEAAGALLMMVRAGERRRAEEEGA